MEVEGIPNGYFSETMEEPQIEQEPLKKSSGGSETVPQPAITASGCFDCNICLDFAVDPVVTLCGHLYCWPCIYKWLHIESASVQQCPVCKASLSQDSLVPLYGRGHTKHTNQSFDIPRRPSSSVHHRGQSEIEPESAISDEDESYVEIHPIPVHRHRHHHYHVHQHEHHHHYPHHGPSNDFLSAPSSPSLGATNRVIHSTAGGVLGGMAIAVLPWMFRNHQEATSMHFASPSPYYAGSNGGSPRQRRQEMEVESSLHQIWVFLFCCAMLCLLLF